jgi:hypothetical protein
MSVGFSFYVSKVIGTNIYMDCIETFETAP